MKGYPDKFAVCATLIFLCLAFPGNGQDSSEVNRQLLDMKLELLDSKIELFNSQLMVWEEKPRELERRLMAVDRKIESLDFDPVYINERLNEIEMLIGDYNRVREKPEPVKKAFISLRPDSIPLEPYLTAVSLNPVRLAEGTFHITYERAVTPKIGLSLSGLATYATEEGLSGYYMSNQRLEYYNISLDSYMPYHNKNISGYGVVLEMKNYLLTDHYRRQRAPVGLYASPSLMFRRLWLTGISEYVFEDEWITEEVTQLLNIYTAGVNVGWKFSLIKVLYLDVYAGGQIRLSKYDNQDGFTKYKSLGNIDFSGVSPTFGISIGILR
ncbi:MAG TPA: hypothetical protein ENO20_05575 [Bacteroides sp.]|nr:hypothetical protein [Bacteroides sp.]